MEEHRARPTKSKVVIFARRIKKETSQCETSTMIDGMQLECE